MQKSMQCLVVKLGQNPLSYGGNNKGKLILLINTRY